MPQNAINFIQGGRAIFTIVSQSTGKRFTYKTYRLQQFPERLYVSVLNGPDNTHNYKTFACLVFDDNGYPTMVITKKSLFTEEAPCYVAFKYTFFNMLVGREIKVDVYHHGTCARCGRVLTVPESIESGYGPECVTHIHNHK